MAKTHGRKPLPLPLSLEHGLHELGYRERQAGDAAFGTRAFRHPRGFYVQVVASNIPGDTDMVTAQWTGNAAERLSVDRLLGHLRVQSARAKAPVREMR